MKKIIVFCISAFLCLLVSGSIIARDFQSIKLPPHDFKKGKMPKELTVTQALWARESTKSFKDQDLDPGDISNILWAAVGVNRIITATDGTITRKLTIPLARNQQHVSVYAVLKQGVYLYDFINNELNLVLAGDHRSETTTGQAYVYDAPLDLIFVSDLSKLSFVTGPELYYTAAISIGCAIQNVYLYVAGTQRLGAVCRTSIDTKLWAEYLGLSDNQMIMGTQTVGYPAD